jgi:hypothetical protein
VRTNHKRHFDGAVFGKGRQEEESNRCKHIDHECLPHPCRQSRGCRFCLQPYPDNVTKILLPTSYKADVLHFNCRDTTNISSPDSTVRRELAFQIRDACINVGFFYGNIRPFPQLYQPNYSSRWSAVKNHPIPESTVQGAVEASQKFFDLPSKTKMEVSRGWCIEYHVPRYMC